MKKEMDVTSYTYSANYVDEEAVVILSDDDKTASCSGTWTKIAEYLYKKHGTFRSLKFMTEKSIPSGVVSNLHEMYVFEDGIKSMTRSAATAIKTMAQRVECDSNDGTIFCQRRFE